MNKKLSHFFLAAVLAMVTLMPMLAQSVSAQTSPDPAPRKTILINSFNRRVSFFSDVALRANDLVGVDRLMVLLAFQLGIPVTELQVEMNGFGLPVDRFIMAELISHSAGVPVSMVVDLLNNQRNFGQIAVQLNFPFKLATLEVNNFINVLIGEINALKGTNVTLTDAEAIDMINAAINSMSIRFSLFQNVLGNQAFDTLFLRRLSLETGMDVNTLIALRGQLPPDLTAAQFASFVLLGNSLGAAVNVALQFDGVAIVTPGGIYGRLTTSQIPIQLFTMRMIVFTKAVNSDGSNA